MTNPDPPLPEVERLRSSLTYAYAEIERLRQKITLQARQIQAMEQELVVLQTRLADGRARERDYQDRIFELLGRSKEQR